MQGRIWTGVFLHQSLGEGEGVNHAVNHIHFNLVRFTKQRSQIQFFSQIGKQFSCQGNLVNFIEFHTFFLLQLSFSHIGNF